MLMVDISNSIFCVGRLVGYVIVCAVEYDIVVGRFVGCVVACVVGVFGCFLGVAYILLVWPLVVAWLGVLGVGKSAWFTVRLWFVGCLACVVGVAVVGRLVCSAFLVVVGYWVLGVGCWVLGVVMLGG